MKYFAAFFALGLIINAQALTEEQKLKLAEHFKICQASTGVDVIELQKVQGGDFSTDDIKAKEWLFCVLKRSDVMTDDGKFLKDIALTKVEDDIRENVAKAIDACIYTIGSKGLESAWDFGKCYRKERPDHSFVLA